MKISFFHIIFLMIFPLTPIIAQPVDGIWFSSHDIRLHKVNERFDLVTTDNGELSSNSYKLDSAEVDTFFYSGGMILEFPEPKEVILKPLGWDGLPARYLKKKEIIKTKKTKYHIDFGDGSEMILRARLSKDYRSEEHFKKLIPSKLEKNEGSDLFEFENTSWQIHADSSSTFNDLNLHIIDTTHVIITQKLQNEIYTDNSEWKEIWYKNHLFFGFQDPYNFEFQIFHFFDTSNGNLFGDAYENITFSKEPPPLRQIVFEKQSFLSKVEVYRIEKQIIGDWIAVNKPLFYDSLYYQHLTSTNNLSEATIIDQHFELNFLESHRFMMLKSGVIKYGNVETEIDTTISGEWKLSPTGNYIQIRADNSYYRFLSLAKLTDNSMELYFDMIALCGDQSMHSIDNRFVRLKK